MTFYDAQNFPWALPRKHSNALHIRRVIAVNIGRVHLAVSTEWVSSQTNESRLCKLCWSNWLVGTYTGFRTGCRYMFALVSHKLTCIAFLTKKLPYVYNNQSLLVRHHTNHLAIVHSRVTVDGCSIEYKYKLLRQFTMTVEGTRCYLCLQKSQNNLLQSHTKCFCSYLGIEQSGNSWKATGYSQNGHPATLQTNYGKLKKKPLCVALQRCRTNR